MSEIERQSKIKIIDDGRGGRDSTITIDDIPVNNCVGYAIAGGVGMFPRVTLELVFTGGLEYETGNGRLAKSEGEHARD